MRRAKVRLVSCKTLALTVQTRLSSGSAVTCAFTRHSIRASPSRVALKDLERRGHLWALKFGTQLLESFGAVSRGALAPEQYGQEEAVRIRAEQYGARTTDFHPPVARRRDGLAKEEEQKES